jgi:hypothetical protein
MTHGILYEIVDNPLDLHKFSLDIGEVGAKVSVERNPPAISLGLG